MRSFLKSGPLAWAALVAISALAGCDTDDGDAGSGGADAGAPVAADPDEGQTVTRNITAAEGGQIATPSGAATLTVPAGALAADTEISVTVQPAADGAAASVYDFGPDGTTFQVPVALSIRFAGTVPDGKEAVLAVHEGGAWQPIAGSRLAGGVVSGEVTHFSRFSVVIRDGQVVAISGCEDIARDFRPCGGPLPGSWRFREVCFESQAIAQDPFEGRCPDARIAGEVQFEGTVEITEETIEPRIVRQTLTQHISVPLACLEGQGCQQIADGERRTCEEDSGVCECTQSDVREPDPEEPKRYRVEGNTILILDAAGEVDDRVDYCVTGDRAVVKVVDDDPDPARVTTFYWVLER